MHPTERTLLLIEGNSTLGQPWIEPASCKFLLAPGSGKKTALIFYSFHFDDEAILEIGLIKDHQKTFTSGIGTTN